MRFSLAISAVFAAGAIAAPVSDCDSLKSLSVLNGAKLFCAEKFPATEAAPVANLPKTNAKRFKEDDERVVRILNSMPESRQKNFCACYPAVASTSVAATSTPSPTSKSSSVSVVVSASATPTKSAASAASATSTKSA